MKQVLFKKRKYTYKDAIRFVGVTLMHYLAFYLFFLLIFGIHFMLLDSFWNLFNPMSWGIWYGCIVGPFVNSVLHVVYSERGLPWFRVTMWAHSFFIVFIVTIAEFV